MSPLLCWLVVLLLLANSTAHAAALLGPWVELASDGAFDVRSITAPDMVNPGIVINGARIHRALAIPDYGYVVLHRVSQGWTGTVYALNDQVLARCRLHGREPACRSAAR